MPTFNTCRSKVSRSPGSADMEGLSAVRPRAKDCSICTLTLLRMGFSARLDEWTSAAKVYGPLAAPKGASTTSLKVVFSPASMTTASGLARASNPGARSSSKTG